MTRWTRPEGPVAETPSTQSAPKAGELRFCRTLDGDTCENPGLYLVLHGGVDGWGDKEWTVLVLHEDPDVDGEAAGQVTQHSVGWLTDWSEPFDP